MYNLIANQNRPGKFSLNELFDAYFSKSSTEEDPSELRILSKFLSYESNIKPKDFEKNIDYNIEDLMIRFFKDRRITYLRLF